MRTTDLLSLSLTMLTFTFALERFRVVGTGHDTNLKLEAPKQEGDFKSFYQRYFDAQMIQLRSFVDQVAEKAMRSISSAAGDRETLPVKRLGNHNVPDEKEMISHTLKTDMAWLTNISSISSNNLARLMAEARKLTNMSNDTTKDLVRMLQHVPNISLEPITNLSASVENLTASVIHQINKTRFDTATAKGAAWQAFVNAGKILDMAKESLELSSSSILQAQLNNETLKLIKGKIEASKR